MLPGIPVVGGGGKGKIELAAFLGPVYGMLIGPFTGFAAAWLGAFVGWVLPPGASGPWGLATTLCPATAALVSGLAVTHRVSKVRGWILASAVLAALIAGWYLTAVGRIAYWYPVLHWAGLAVLLTTGRWLPKLYDGRKSMPAAAVLAGYAGIVSDHMVGNLLFISLGGPLLGAPTSPEKLASIFKGVLLLSAVERATMLLLLAIIGVPVMYAVRASGVLKLRR